MSGVDTAGTAAPILETLQVLRERRVRAQWLYDYVARCGSCCDLQRARSAWYSAIRRVEIAEAELARADTADDCEGSDDKETP